MLVTLIKSRMNSLKLTQENLRDMLNKEFGVVCTQSWISKMLSHDKRLNGIYFLMIAYVLKIPAKNFLNKSFINLLAKRLSHER